MSLLSSNDVRQAEGPPPDLKSKKRPSYAAAASAAGQSGPPVTRSSLQNALTFDLRSISGKLPELAKVISDHYGDEISGIQYLPQIPAVQFGFREGVEIARIIEDGFGINSQLIPKYRCYQSYSNIVRIGLSQLPCLEEAKEKAEIAKALAECGKVVDLRFFRDPHTGRRTTRGCLHLDHTPKDGLTLAQIPSTIRVGEANVILSWRDAPAFCTYCRTPGHVKSACEKKRASDAKRAQRNKRAKLDEGKSNNSSEAGITPRATSTKKSKGKITDTVPTAGGAANGTTNAEPVAERPVNEIPAANESASGESAAESSVAGTEATITASNNSAGENPADITNNTEPLDMTVKAPVQQVNDNLPPAASPATAESKKLDSVSPSPPEPKQFRPVSKASKSSNALMALEAAKLLGEGASYGRGSRRKRQEKPKVVDDPPDERDPGDGDIDRMDISNE